MKRITAFVKTNMLDDVIFALHEVPNFPGASISKVQGIGSGSRDHLKHVDRTPFHAFPTSVRMEIVCPAATVTKCREPTARDSNTARPLMHPKRPQNSLLSRERTRVTNTTHFYGITCYGGPSPASNRCRAAWVSSSQVRALPN